MNKKAIYITLALIIVGLIFLYLNFQFRSGNSVGIVKDLNRMVVEYDPLISSTYKKPYSELKNELIYARLSYSEEGQDSQTIKTIRNKDQLIEIIREFDKLKSTIPQEYNSTELKISNVKFYTLTMWREGSSVSYVFLQNDSNFYEGSTAMRTKNGNMILRKMPEKLVRLIVVSTTK